MSRLSGESTPYRTHRRRGESSFGSCLLMIVLVLGGLMFFWAHFGKNRPLIMAGQQCMLAKEFNQDADQAYKHHFKEHNQANAAQSRGACKSLYDDTMKGKYKDKSSDFEQAYNEADQKLIDSIVELDQNSVPPAFHKYHVMLSSSYKPLYESLEALKAGYFAEGEEQKKQYSLAKNKLAEGIRVSQAGENGILQVLTQ